MVQVVGTLLVTALLVTPAAHGTVSWSKLPLMFGLDTIFRTQLGFLGAVLSAELNTGSGAMIALVAAIIFSIVAFPKFFVLFNPSNLARLSAQIPLDMPESSIIEVESEVK